MLLKVPYPLTPLNLNPEPRENPTLPPKGGSGFSMEDLNPLTLPPLPEGFSNPTGLKTPYPPMGGSGGNGGRIT